MSFEIKTYHGKYNIQRRTQAIKYIAVHYTGSGTSKAGSALANCKYFSGANRNASAHYFIDDADIYEYANPSESVAWHVGDGHGKYGITNANSIGIEVCSGGADFTGAEEERLRFLVQLLMQHYHIDAAHVVRHYDASRKACPWPYVPNGGDPTGAKWRALHAYITSGAATTKEDDDEVTSQDIANIAAAVWQYNIAGKGVQAQDRLYGIDAIQLPSATAGIDNLNRTSDPTGRNVNMDTHDHVKYMAAKLDAMQQTLDALKDEVAKLNK